MKNELNIFTGGYRPWYPRNWWSNIRYFFRTIKWGWQRATKGYSDYDTWDLDVFYSRLMIASMSQFRAEVQGYPFHMKSIYEWYDILDKIILLLKQANDDEPLEEKNNLEEWYDEYLSGEHKEDEGVKAKVDQYYKREGELHEIRVQKRKEAFELLLEHYEHLWW
jgi:hypothetical protein